MLFPKAPPLDTRSVPALIWTSVAKLLLMLVKTRVEVTPPRLFLFRPLPVTLPVTSPLMMTLPSPPK